MKKIYAGILVIFIAPVFFTQPLQATEGYYRDLFQDAGYGLSNRKYMYAAEYLGLSVEYFATNDLNISDEKAGGDSVDHNGAFLYPDGSPRFRLIYVNGGTGGWALHYREISRQHYRDFFNRGGGYTGSCAAFYAAHSYREGVYKSNYLRIFPGNARSSGGTKDTHDHQLETSSRFFTDFCYKYQNLRDGWVANVTHYLGGATYPGTSGVEYLARHKNTSSYLENQFSIVAYKTAGSGRMVICGSHPEYAGSGERMHLQAAMLEYSLDGTPPPQVKASLTNGVTRQMNNNDWTNHEKIGDKQYHHFTVDIPAGATSLTVTLNGDDAYNLDLFARSGGFAFKGEDGVITAESSAADEVITISNPSPGTWYIGVKGSTPVLITPHGTPGSASNPAGEYWEEYTGNLGVLNGVAYTITADWGTGPVPTPTPTPTPIPGELIIDNLDGGFSHSSAQDAWVRYPESGQQSGQHFHGSHYYNRQLNNGQTATGTATWTFDVPEPGYYDVYAWWWAGSWRPVDVPYTINHATGSETVDVNQQQNSGQWNLLGRYYFTASGSVVVSDQASTAGCGTQDCRDVVADAVRLVLRTEGPTSRIFRIFLPLCNGQ